MLTCLLAYSKEAFDFLTSWTEGRRVAVNMLRKDHVRRFIGG
jgi:hypothetical protein